MAFVDGLPSVLLKNVAQSIQQKVPSDTAPIVEEFASLLYSNISTLDLAHRNESDMYGATMSLWNSLNGHIDDTPVIKVFNPEYLNTAGNQATPLSKLSLAICHSWWIHCVLP